MRRIVVEVDAVDVGGDDEALDAEVPGQEGGGAVLVDDRLDPLEHPLVVDDRDAAAAAGMIMGTSAKLIRGLERSWASVVFGLATFAAIGLLRIPLAGVVLVIVPISIGVALWRRRTP